MPPWRRGRVVRQRPAKPRTAVRICSAPSCCALLVTVTLRRLRLRRSTPSASTRARGVTARSAAVGPAERVQPRSCRVVSRPAREGPVRPVRRRIGGVDRARADVRLPDGVREPHADTARVQRGRVSVERALRSASIELRTSAFAEFVARTDGAPLRFPQIGEETNASPIPASAIRATTVSRGAFATSSPGACPVASLASPEADLQTVASRAAGADRAGPRRRPEVDSAAVAGNGGSVGTAVLGAGPAGLTAAYVLGLRGAPGAVFEADGVVGGIAKTVEYNGYRFDLGGHRFFTKIAQVQRLWEEVLGEEFLVRPRLSRIYYDGKYLAYPLQARDVVSRLGIVESSLCALSYARSKLTPIRHEIETFEDFVTVNFGSRLYDAFFASYTREGVGRPRVGDPLGVGGAADQGLLVLEGVARSAARHARQADDAHRAVPLSAARPGPDVGGLPRACRGAGHPGAPEPPCAHDPPRPPRRPVGLRRARREDRGACPSTPCCRASP